MKKLFFIRKIIKQKCYLIWILQQAVQAAACLQACRRLATTSSQEPQERHFDILRNHRKSKNRKSMIKYRETFVSRIDS